MNRAELLDVIEGRAQTIAKEKGISIQKAMGQVAQEDPAFYQRYCEAPEAPPTVTIAKTASEKEADRFEQMVASPSAKVWLEKFHYIRKASRESLADVAVAQLELLAREKKAANPNLSEPAALIATISEGLARQDQTAPDPVRFLLSILDDPHSAIISAEQARKIGTTQAKWAEHGLAL